MQIAECKYQNAEWPGEELTADFADDADSPETNHGWTRIGISPHLPGAKSEGQRTNDKGVGANVGLDTPPPARCLDFRFRQT